LKKIVDTDGLAKYEGGPGEKCQMREKGEIGKTKEIGETEKKK